MNATGADGGRLQLTGCYLMTVTVLGKKVTHPFFVCNLNKISAILGVDFLRRTGLSYDAVANKAYFPKSPKVARLAKEVYLPARSATLCPINSEDDSLQILSPVFFKHLCVHLGSTSRLGIFYHTTLEASSKLKLAN